MVWHDNKKKTSIREVCMNIKMLSSFYPLVSVIVESESESEDIAAKVLRPVLHPVQRRHHPRGGDEQCAAARHEDALQVRPEGFFV